MRLAAGSRLGPYEVLSALGAGGMGEVFRARDTRLGREVAVKILPERLADNEKALARFEREARAVAALSHPNILAIHDFGHEDGVVFAVTELLEGESLDRRLSREELPWKKALEIGAAVADGLASAHGRGIVHRDLKPANVFVTREGLVKILDFGLARHDPLISESAGTAGLTAAAPDTEPGTVLGTVGYMSPEQVRGEPADARSDIFSLGCILYEMLTGRRAFREKTHAETMAAILRDHPPELPDSGRTMAPGINGVVTRCLQKNPEERFQSARDLAFALREILGASMTSPVSGRSVAAAPLPRRRGIWIGAAILTAVVVAALVLLVVQLRSRLLSSSSRIHSLAVLPLANLSGDPQQEYFADGVTEQVITNLARFKDLRVISRTSAMTYKATKKRLPEIARELHVDAVVDGSVARVGDKIKVSAELIEAATDKHLWAESYERDVRDVLALEGEVAGAIARKVEIELTPQDRARLEGSRRINPDAYEAYVRGRYYYNKRTQADLQNALEQFQRALDADPTYAAAYAGLADAYSLTGYQNYLAPRDAFPKAKAAALKALELDPGLGAAHASLGYTHLYYDWDFPASESEFRRAIALDPNLVTARHFYSIYLTAMLRPKEARLEIERAHTLDPLSVLVSSDMGFELYYDREYEPAINALRDAIAMNPKAPPPHFWLARVYQAQGRYAQAVTEFQSAGPGVSQWPPALAGLGHLYGILGKRSEALQVIAEMRGMAEKGFVTAYAPTLVYLGIGDKEKTLAGLNRCLEERSNWMVWLLKDPRWDPMRSEPRFQEIIHKVGFPADAQARQPRS
jgi:eukaryotic-like serine/threonine-protein kinase